ncbi:MAG TPA: hypothetical protein VMW63_00280 [Methanoregulaceae archaeon]|nr:hypothetical protein [Methanoregulaceae archaeon]
MDSDDLTEEDSLLGEMNTIIVEGDDIQRKRLLSRIIVLLFTSTPFAGNFVKAGGISLLILATRDPLEKVRLHSVHALCRLADLGYGREISSAGAEKDLNRICSDPYRPLRELAGQCLSRISGPERIDN